MKCLYCSTENVFREYFQHRSATSTMNAAAKFKQIIALRHQPEEQQMKVADGIRNCLKHGNEQGLDAFGKWLVATYEQISPSKQIA
jgi:hypothetical protein